MSGLIVGLGWIALDCVILLLLGAIIQWILGIAKYPPSENMVKLFLLAVAIYAIVSIIVLFLTGTTLRSRIGETSSPFRIASAYSAPAPA